MNDPHVEELVYYLETGNGGITFQDPPPLEEESHAFSVFLEEGVLTLSMKEHHSTEDSARRAVAEYLRSWEIDVALQYGSPQLHFVFDSAKIIDRNPPPGGPVALSGRAVGTSSATASLTVSKMEYPQPPREFVADSDVTAMWERYQRYTEGREPLLSMAYWCLTFLQDRAKDHPKKGSARQKVTSMYRVDPAVLDTLGHFTATLGDEIEARKINSDSQLREPTPKERKWIEAALTLLIRRAGQYASDPDRDWPKLTLENLPNLD